MQRVGKEIKSPSRHHLGIQLPQRAGAGVAGVGEQGVAAGCPFVVDRREGVIGDEGFPAHLHPFRWIVDLQPQRDRTDGAHIGGDLLTAAAIAAGCCPLQHPMAVAQGQGIAVNLELAHQG